MLRIVVSGTGDEFGPEFVDCIEEASWPIVLNVAVVLAFLLKEDGGFPSRRRG